MKALGWLFFAVGLIACGAMEAGDGGWPDGDADADADGDNGSDAGPEGDAGGGGDADADADADSDADSDCLDVPCPEDSERACSDGWDNDENGLVDCWEPDCGSSQACCEEAATVLTDDDFGAGLDAEKWKPFGSPAPEAQGSIFRPSGDDSYESGIVSKGEPVHFEGELSLQVAFDVSAECDGCTELIGVAFTAGDEYTATATVEPIAGAVIDVATQRILAVVQGAVEAEIATAGAQVLNLTLVIRPDRRVVLLDDQAGALFTSRDPLDPSLGDFFVAVFGRGGQAMGVDRITLSSRLCSDPSSGSREPDPVVSSVGAPVVASAVRSPSAIPSPEGGLEMLFTMTALSGSAIGRAVSDDGRTWLWDHPESPVIADVDLPAGHRDADDPSLVSTLGIARFAAVSAARTDDGTRAIATFASEDGVSWDAGPGDQPVDLGAAACASVRDPALAVTQAGGLELFFTCEDADGRTSIGWATSPDGIEWTVQDGSILPAEGDAEADGIAAPAVLIDPGSGVHELWYEARDGVRRSIRYAASERGADWTRWEGEILAPGEPGSWDDLAVGEPSVALMPDGKLELFYTGQGSSGQAIGLVSRRLPLLP
ncbi:MAG: hypothetical protein HYY06_05960 [Deltaproteobacteria bacterium]|nr:hypothetical protein [Deltaproteobacteria bacterium]